MLKHNITVEPHHLTSAHPHSNSLTKVNGAKVSDDPSEVQQWLTNTSGSLMLTILPSFNPAMSDVKQLFVRAFFDYDPATDDMCPSKEFGLPFKFGEILRVWLCFTLVRCVCVKVVMIHFIC